jgi:leader peptidase (prepilin peptidase)/N-methyltransferase
LWLIAEAYYRLRHEEGLGMGDVKMLAMIGAFIGWKLMIVTLMMASFAGSVVGLLLIASRKGDMKYALPFGTFLAMGAALAVTIGPGLLAWYLKFWEPI